MFDINVNPTVGFFTYKTGKLTLQIHDRSRLNEISDFIKPEVYTQTTLWITYGWRCPVDDNNAYFSFINEKMITREAYGIKNCSLDLQGGGVNIVLELFTKGVSELNTIKINDSDKNMKSVMSEIEGLVATIKEQRIALKLQSPENATKEIRFFKLLDAAEAGEFPDLSDPDILKSIDEVRSTLRSTIVNESLVQKVSTLLDNVSKLYTTTSVLVNSRRRRSRNSAGIVVDTNYSGMELFTSPQTLVNTNDLDGTLRYQETIDKFKPFGTVS